MSNDILTAYLHGLGIMALLTMTYGHICRQTWHSEIKRSLIGLCFGLGAVAVMAAPAHIRPGVIVDARTIIVALGAAFGGIPAALISSGIAIAFRYQLGGAGVLPGTLCIAFAGLIGLFWAAVVRTRVRSAPARLAVFAAMAPFALMSMFVLPLEAALRLLELMFIPNTICSIIAAFILGALLEKEQASIRSEELLRQRATSDGLTGLGNRTMFDEVLGKRLAETEEGRSSTALLIIDADHFKSVNDRFGHAVGDEVLRRLAVVLKSAIRQEDYAARLGGEEFGIILDTRSPNRAHKIAERIRAAVQFERFEVDGQAFQISVSIGCAVARVFETPQSLYEAADHALYRAKDDGRNRISTAVDQNIRWHDPATNDAL